VEIKIDKEVTFPIIKNVSVFFSNDALMVFKAVTSLKESSDGSLTLHKTDDGIVKIKAGFFYYEVGDVQEDE
jgi:hypothetical protein